MGRRLVIGCGYLGYRVAQRWLASGDHVIALTRSEQRAATFRQERIHPIVQDIAGTWKLGSLPEVDTVLFAVGFDRRGDHPMEKVYVDGLRQTLDHLVGDPRLIYISSTGVYGDADGEWLDETVECHPVREGGRNCLAAERLLRQSRFSNRANILRPAGIYGPDRVPNLSALRGGEPLAVNPEAWLNLIHVEDLASTVCQLADATPQHLCYNVTDGHPVLRRDYYDFLCTHFDLPAVTYADLEQLAPTRRGGANKRVSNRRLLDEFHPQFRYPTYREGLMAELK